MELKLRWTIESIDVGCCFGTLSLELMKSYEIFPGPQTMVWVSSQKPSQPNTRFAAFQRICRARLPTGSSDPPDSPQSAATKSAARASGFQPLKEQEKYLDKCPHWVTWTWPPGWEIIRDRFQKCCHFRISNQQCLASIWIFNRVQLKFKNSSKSKSVQNR